MGVVVLSALTDKYIIGANMAISNKQNINIGQPNESVGSDSLYAAFTKTKQNFDTLFACASPLSTVVGNTGISVDANNTTGVLTLTNSGVTELIAGTGVVLNQANGNVTISAVGSTVVKAGYFVAGKEYVIRTLGTTDFTAVGAATNTVGVVFTATSPGDGTGTAYYLPAGGGTLSSVGLNPASTSRLTVTGSPLVTDGAMSIDLAASGVTAGVYSNPTLTVDSYGRVTTATNGSTSGTVTSVGLTAGFGIQINGGPVTSAGTITVTNTGVTRINPGQGILVNSANGNVTISTQNLGGTVTSVAISSTTLTVTNSPILGAGVIYINLPNQITLTGNLTSGNLLSNGRLILNGSEDLAPSTAANLLVTSTYFSTSLTETTTLAAGTEGQIKTFMMKNHGGDMVITVTNAAWGGFGTMSFTATGQACTLQYVAGNWYCIGNNGVTFA